MDTSLGIQNLIDFNAIDQNKLKYGIHHELQSKMLSKEEKDLLDVKLSGSSSGGSKSS